MQSFRYFLIFLISASGFIIYNETILLPYQVWTPQKMMTVEAMGLRDPLINMLIVMGSFLFMVIGVKSYEKYHNSMVTGSGDPLIEQWRDDAIP